MTAQPRTALAVVLVGIGLLWLLGALGLVSTRVLSALLTYWPLLLIGAGLDLLLGQRRVLGLPFTLLALVAIAVLALIPGRGIGREQRFSEAVGIAQEAEVRLELSNAETTLGALEASDILIEATARGGGNVRFEVAGGERKRVFLGGRSGIGFGRGGRWDIGLNPALPLDLEIDGGSGRAELDLSGLELRTLTLETGSGGSRVTLPVHEPRTEVRLATGSGRTELSAPAGADLSVRAETGSGPTSFRVEPEGYLTLQLASGSGSVEIDLPEDANIRLEVLDDGSGRLNLPESLLRVSGEGEEGVWQTEGFAAGAGQVIITVQDSGSGSIRIY